MHWIYILRCDNNIIYVGETTRLYKRLIEHKNGEGSDTTSEFKPYKLMGIYKLIKDGLTFDCPINKDMYEQGFIDENKPWGLELENQITLMYMKAMNTKWDNVYGGKYHIGYRPENNPSNNITLFRPYCKCKLPADINIYNNKKYWRCCKKNCWDGLNEFLENKLEYPLLEPCNFYKEYKEKEEYVCENYIYGDPKRKELYKDLIKKSSWLENIETDYNYVENEDLSILNSSMHCVNCDGYVWMYNDGRYRDNGIEYLGHRLLLCKNCFVNYNNELSKKYTKEIEFLEDSD
jgi:hypothetical protein